MSESHEQPGSDGPLLAAIYLIVAVYAVVTAAGWRVPPHEPHQVGEVAHVWAVAPFVVMLLAIAVLPLIAATALWWEHNSSKLIVAAILGLVTLAYLATIHPEASLTLAADAFVHTMLYEYVPFIVLLLSLYTISGGIRVEGDLRARPSTNTAFLAIGGVLASFIGTTGAAMVLIRPLLETNRERRHVVHTVVLFIFIVCNCGGLLLPVGDPPLLLGYLRGVPFLWTLSLWKEWLLVNGLLLVVYYLWDRLVYYPRETQGDIARDETQRRPLRLLGLWPNAVLLVGVVLAVALLDSSKPLPGTTWQPWPYLREVVQLVLVALSLVLGSREVRRRNQFNYGAIVEVAVLFVGIFLCMQPAIEILRHRGHTLALDTPRAFFWATGSLSSVLDNAPTYLVFFETAKSLGNPGDQLPRADLLTGISLGAVFMGAMTYIGNGPNFMVRTIAERSGVKMPSFFGYLLYSFGILLPILALMTWLSF
jgi:Na+/H+ antiporter NhaD/arsenite permease-like protein